MKSNLTDEEVRLVTGLLAKLEPGYLPFDIFHQVAKLTALPVVECVPLRQHDGKTLILLLEREADDPIWPGYLHSPGTIVRATDTLRSALERVIKDELAGVTASEPVFVRNIIHRSERGTEVSQVYWTEVSVEPLVGAFYDVDSLPAKMVQAQLHYLPDVIAHYKTARNKEWNQERLVTA